MYAVVPAGGAGTRLWPLSKATHPKFLLDLTGTGRSLIQQTWDRLAPLSTRIVVVTGTDHATAIGQQLPQLDAKDLLVEPAPRNSMPAIGLAAAVLHQRVGDVVLGSFAADHVIYDQQAFAAAVDAACQAASAGYLATIGIEPTEPSTAYGYIQAGQPLQLPGTSEVQTVERFVEKPDRATAQTYLAQGSFRWNAGMFVFRTGVLLGALASFHPDMHGALIELARAWDTDQRGSVAAKVWPGLTKISIDHAIAEPLAAVGGVATTAGKFDWTDLGDFAALAELRPQGELSVATEPGPLLVSDSPDSLVVRGSKRAVVLMGLPDVVVVDTPQAVLVTRRDLAQQVKDVTDQLRAAGHTDLL